MLEIPCDASSDPSNGTAGDCTSSLSHDSNCTPICNDGYSPIQPYCDTTGILSPPASCQAVTCPEPSVPINGSIGDCTGKVTGESCNLLCSDGYSGTGLTVTCSADTGPNSLIDTSGASCSRMFF